MPSLRELLNNLPNFRYYNGVGNFTANNIPYSGDRPGGDTSRQPYVVQPVGQRWSPSGISTGIPPFGELTTATRSVADVKRLGKFLTDVPKGPFWIGKQIGLQRMNPDVGNYFNKYALTSDTINPVTNTAVKIDKDFDDTRTYNPLGLTLLAQAGGSGFGLHFLRHGKTPTLGNNTPYDEKYSTFAKKEDRLRRLVTSFSDPSEVSNYNKIISKYKGGPASFLGVGETIIKSGVSSQIDSTFGASVYYNSFGSPRQELNSFIPLSIDTIINIDPRNTPSPDQDAIGDKRDFRRYKNNVIAGAKNAPVLTNSDYQTLNMEDRIGVMRSRYSSNKYKKVDSSTFGATGSLSNYWVKGPVDGVNSVSLYKSAEPFGDVGANGVNDINGNLVRSNGEISNIRDLIKFRIKIFDNDDINSNMGTYMVFRAFINSFNNSMSSKWSPYTYVGRGEEFYAYEGFNESYTVSFTIAALSRSEMKPLYQKLNYLKSSMAPDYSNGAKMRGNIAELTVGDYVHYQPGVITDLNIAVPQEANWEIALDYLKGQTGAASDGIDSDMHELPQLLNVDMTFLPIYKFLPRKGPNVPFIGINNYRATGSLDTTNPREWLRNKF